MKRGNGLAIGLLAGFILFFINVCYTQTIDELRITVKQLEAKNSSLEAQLKKSKQNTNGKRNAELEKRVQEMQEEINELLRENIRLRGKEIPVVQDSTSQFQILEIQDPFFKAYLLRYCDMDNDGKFSKWDAEHTYIIDFENNSKLLRKSREVVSLDLDDLKYFTNLKKLVCSGNSIRTLNLTNCACLETLIVNNCNLKFLDVSKNLKLKHLECNHNMLYILNLDNNNQLLEIDVSKNEIDILSIVNCKKLTVLLCSNNTIEVLDLSNNLNLRVVDCSNNKLSQLNFVYNTTLDSVCCQSNSLIKLNLQNNRDIKYLDCSRNRNLTEVFISEGHYVLSEKKDGKTVINNTQVR